MKITFETIGNATLIVSERDKTLLCTDPWFDKDFAYFGSWSLSHKFPEQQRLKCENSCLRKALHCISKPGLNSSSIDFLICTFS